MSPHVVFLGHIHFFSIPSITNSLTRYDLICINPFFFFDFDSLSSQVPSTSNNSSHVQPIRTDHSAGTDILLSDTFKAHFSFIVPQALFKVMDPYLCQSICIRKS